MTALKLANHTEDILKLFDDGVNTMDISRRYHCYQQNVANLLKKYRTIPSISGSINSSYFSKIDSHLKAYFLGFIAGDGCLVKSSTSSSTTLTITLNSRDRVVLNKLREELSMTRPVYEFVSHGRFSHVRLVTSDRQIIKDLTILGISPRKSLTMPNILTNVPEEFRTSMILGIFDADGSCNVRTAITKGKNGREYSSIKQSVQIRATMEMCLAIVKHLEIGSYHISTADSIPNLSINSKSEFTKFFNKVYSDCPFFLQRKYDKFLPIVNQDQTISSSEENTSSTELGARVSIIA